MSEDQANQETSQIDALSDLAQETRVRRELAESEAARPRPEFIYTVDQSEVVYTFIPAAIPLVQVDPNKLNESLQALYNLQLTDPDFSPLVNKIPREQLAQMNESELLSRLVKETDMTLRWASGRFPLRDDFVTIRSLVLNFESILVSVAGVSQVAEVIAKEVIELLWQLAGSKKKFTDIEPLMQIVGYATATRISLGYGAECLLNPVLLKFLDNNLAQGKGFASWMGRTKVSPDQGANPVNAVGALDDITIHVSKFDPLTGFSDDSEVRFSIMAQSDFRTGRLRVTSSMPYERHVEFLVKLFESVGPSALS